MKELLITIAKHLVDDPNSVHVIEETREDGTVVLKLNVASEDVGKVIGKKGRIARDIRTVVKAAAIHENKRVNIEIA